MNWNQIKTVLMQYNKNTSGETRRAATQTKFEAVR